MENDLAWHFKINSKFLMCYVGDEELHKDYNCCIREYFLW